MGQNSQADGVLAATGCVLCAKTVQIHWVLVKSVNKEKKSTRIDLHSAARVKQDVPRQLATAVSPLSATLHLFNVRKQDTHFQQCSEPCPRGSLFQFAWQDFPSIRFKVAVLFPNKNFAGVRRDLPLPWRPV